MTKPVPGRDDDRLPLTAEVGDEGGSYADAVVQRTTREGDLPETTASMRVPPPALTESPEVEAPPQEPEDGVHFPQQPPKR